MELPRSKRYYDAMLHIEGDEVARTVSFRISDGKLTWLGEEEIHFSGREFKTIDGTSREQLILSYSTVAASGVPKGLQVHYWGPDQSLIDRDVRGNILATDARDMWDHWKR